MVAFTDEQLNRFIDENLRPISEHLTVLKPKIASILARSNEFSGVVGAHGDADVITATRSDAGQLPTIQISEYNDLVYALGLLNNVLVAITDSTLETFAVRDYGSRT